MYMRKITLVLVVLSIFLLVLPTSAWQTFYLDPKDPHWVRKEDPAGRLTDKGDRWVSECLAGDPRPKIYFKILEFDDKGGLIKFWYAKIGGWNMLHLYASKDGSKYVELWRSPEEYSVSKTKAIVEIPPGYKYFYFYLRDGNDYAEDIILWKEIQFIVFDTPTPLPPTLPTPPPHLRPSPPFTLQLLSILALVITCVVIVGVLIVAKLKKTKLKKV